MITVVKEIRALTSGHEISCVLNRCTTNGVVEFFTKNGVENTVEWEKGEFMSKSTRSEQVEAKPSTKKEKSMKSR